MKTHKEGTPYKVALFLTRDPGIEASNFSNRWVSVVPPSRPKGLSEYVHNSAALIEVPIKNAPSAPFDAVDEFLCSGADAAGAWFASQEFAREWLEPRVKLLSAPIKAVSGLAVPVWRQDSAASVDAIKILTLPVRRADMSMASFAKHWIVTHAGLALAGPNTRERLQLLTTTPADGRTYLAFERASFDGIGVIKFDSAASLNAEFASDHYREVMAPDEVRFTDTTQSRAMMVRETVVLASDC